MHLTQYFEKIFRLTIYASVWILFITKGKYVVRLVGGAYKYVIVKLDSFQCSNPFNRESLRMLKYIFLIFNLTRYSRIGMNRL